MKILKKSNILTFGNPNFEIYALRSMLWDLCFEIYALRSMLWDFALRSMLWLKFISFVFSIRYSIIFHDDEMLLDFSRDRDQSAHLLHTLRQLVQVVWQVVHRKANGKVARPQNRDLRRHGNPEILDIRTPGQATAATLKWARIKTIYRTKGTVVS